MKSYMRVKRTSDGAVVGEWATPMLISVGGGEAFQPEDSHFWRLREDGDPAGTVYTRVRIEHLDDYRVDVLVKPVGPGEADEEEAYADYFIVQAAGEQEAMRLAEAEATADVERRFGDEYGSVVTTNRALKGVSI